MKIVTVLGTRPEIIRLSRIIGKLDQLCEHKIVHTGQNFDPNLSDIFFQQLRIRQPDYYLGVGNEGLGQQIGKILSGVDEILEAEAPDALLILGDTNSGLCSFIAKRRGIPVYHMEAGNRCYDDRVPEEVNRRVIDHSSTILMPYTQRSKENLLREGIANQRIYVIGNPIKEVLDYYSTDIDCSDIHSRLKIQPRKYFLVTMHRSENVDIENRLQNIATALEQLQRLYGYPVICSIHPRTKQKLQKYGIDNENAQIQFLAPLGLFDFVALEKTAFCTLSDSGTVQEESCIFGVPNVTIRDVTERPETIECGSNILSGVEPENILHCVHNVVSQKGTWNPPSEYLARNVSNVVLKIVGGFLWRE